MAQGFRAQHSTFDIIDHEILLDHLNHRGVQRHALQWLKPHLTDLHQFGNINEQFLNVRPVKYGVPLNDQI